MFTLSDYRPNNKEDLRKKQLDIRKNHIAFSVSEQDADTTVISFPMFNYEQQVVAALAVSGLSKRFKRSALDNIKTEGMRTALSISHQLGYKN